MWVLVQTYHFETWVMSKGAREGWSNIVNDEVGEHWGGKTHQYIVIESPVQSRFLTSRGLDQDWDWSTKVSIPQKTRLLRTGFLQSWTCLDQLLVLTSLNRFFDLIYWKSDMYPSIIFSEVNLSYKMSPRMFDMIRNWIFYNNIQQSLLF